MIGNLSLGVINIRNINLWAHVGVLDKERLLGQNFLLDVSLWLNVSDAAIHDDMNLTVDYSLAIKGLQELSFKIKCLTIEKFSEDILDYLEDSYGRIPIKIALTKCDPPVEGFTGTVAIERNRNFE